MIVTLHWSDPLKVKEYGGFELDCLSLSGVAIQWPKDAFRTRLTRTSIEASLWISCAIARHGNWDSIEIHPEHIFDTAHRDVMDLVVVPRIRGAQDVS